MSDYEENSRVNKRDDDSLEDQEFIVDRRVQKEKTVPPGLLRSWLPWLLLIPCIVILVFYFSSGAVVAAIIGQHRMSAPDPTPSVKVLAYIFPQFHAIPENDKNWGTNFTEWTNVRKVTHNQYNIEIQKPHEDIGYYNLLDFDQRARQADLLREIGVYGAVFHHYWFQGPVMDKVLKLMLDDGEPNIPFMLNWANEPWTKRWDGIDSSEVLLQQNYGDIDEWRRHFDYLLQYFRHPRYIRSEGRVQFMVYAPMHMKETIKPMFQAFRKWAIEEELGGLDIIETRWAIDPFDRPTPDAVGEFAPHIAGIDHAEILGIVKNSRIYHKGTYVCLDTTPRHSTHPEEAYINMFCNPTNFYYHFVEMLQLIKLNPNPFGSENFLFVNAMNEWGEGNTFEPSVQHGYGFANAIKEAIKTSDATHQWVFDLQREDNKLKHTQQQATVQDKDVCVLVRVHRLEGDNTPVTLSKFLLSLSKQTNPNWMAILFGSVAVPGWLVTEMENLHDGRMKHYGIPDEVLQRGLTDDQAADWILKNLEQVSPQCKSSKYLLVTNSYHIYNTSTFEEIMTFAEPAHDLIGVSFASRKLISDLENSTTPIKWNDRCTRFNKTDFCAPSKVDDNDLSALFINLPKFLESKLEISSFSSSHEMTRYAVDELGWKWGQVTNNVGSCHSTYGDVFTPCYQTGRIWVDSPKTNETGCHEYRIFWERYQNHFDMWDWENYKANPLCLRYNEKAYDLKNQD